MADQGELTPAQQIWTIGDYPAVARLLAPIAAEAVRHIEAGPGRRVLDVGTGDGNATVLLARQGADTHGCDPTPAQLRHTADRLAAAGVQATLELAGAEKLPYPDQHFDGVVSVLAAIFSPHPGQAAAELVRVCRPGGTVVLTSWAIAPTSWRARLDAVLGIERDDATPASGPDAWGDPNHCRKLFANAGLDVTCQQRPFQWEFASPEDAVSFFLTASGPVMAMADHVEGGPDRYRQALLQAVSEANVATRDRAAGCVLEHPFLLVHGTRTSA